MAKILIADDDATIRGLVARILKPLGKHEIRFSTSVMDTRVTCESFQPDVLIIDNLDGGGVALANELHARGSKPRVINISVAVAGSAPQIKKGTPDFTAKLRAKVVEYLPA